MRRPRRNLLLFLTTCAVLLFLRSPFSFDSSPIQPSSSSRSSSQIKQLNGVNYRQPFAFSAFTPLMTSISKTAPRVSTNILVFAGSTSAASRLLPLAADLASELEANDERPLSAVHFLFMGPYSVDLEFFCQANGLNSTTALPRLHIHDARARLNSRSQSLPPANGAGSESVTMFEINPVSAKAALDVAVRTLRPEATVWSRQLETDSEFGNTIASLLGPPSSPFAPIDIPSSDIEDLGWLALLGPAGLKSWSSHEVDIIIPVTSHTGSVVRLLSSISRARYYNFFPRPRITIYTPPGVVDANLLNFIDHTLSYPRERIVIQSLPTPFVTSRHQTLKEAMFSGALRAHNPSSRHAHTVLLSDTVILSPYWFQWTMLHILSYFPEVRTALEINGPLSPIAGISLCPSRPVSISDEEPFKENDSNDLYYLTQSRASLSCTLFFAPHFRVLQTFLATQSSEAQRRTLPIPPELDHLRTQKSALTFDAHELLLPIYIRGYLFLAQNERISDVPAVYESSVSARPRAAPISTDGSLQPVDHESYHSLITSPLYIVFNSLREKYKTVYGRNDDSSSGLSQTGVIDAKQWEYFPIYPDLSTSDSSSSSREPFVFESVKARGEAFASTVSPKCNTPVSLSRKTSNGENDDEEEEYRRSLIDSESDFLENESKPADDDWSDVFCPAEQIESADGPGAATGIEPNSDQMGSSSSSAAAGDKRKAGTGRAKSLEEEKRERKKSKVVDASKEPPRPPKPAPKQKADESEPSTSVGGNTSGK
ncbi:hypothetical protein BZA70DRAFT_284572 [Myxozyma melibiosi]|uniref:Uncharacterized protein n=1 Tax=Myxozyma melibiosi TaxID=54550 RepID=A0ABR1EZK2_9ASCO